MNRLLSFICLAAAILVAPVHAQFFNPPIFAPQAPGFSSVRSLIFTAASSQSLTKTGSTSINTQKFTISVWFKRASTGTTQIIWDASNGLAAQFAVFFRSDDTLEAFCETQTPTTLIQKRSTATYTDTSSWHHLLVGVDTTQATAGNRTRIWVDGTQVTSFSVDTNAAQNTNLPVNFASTYFIGASPNYFNGRMDQFYYIDGQQYDPTAFITGTPGVPKAYTGSYTGIFDFYLSFEDNTSTTTLGADSSGEGNNWTLVNMTTGNSSTDVP